MNLHKFVSYCKLSGLIRAHHDMDGLHHKVLIDRGDVHCVLLYAIAGEGAIVQCSLSIGELSHPNPTLENLVPAFFPNK